MSIRVIMRIRLGGQTRFEYICVHVTDEEHWNRESVTFSYTRTRVSGLTAPNLFGLVVIHIDII